MKCFDCRNRKNGLSIVELMVFLAICVILSLVFLPRMRGAYSYAGDSIVMENMFQLKIAAEDFSTMALGLYPAAPTNSVSEVLSDIGISSANQKRIADNCPATCFDINTGIGTALLPGNKTFANPFLLNGNCLDVSDMPPHQSISPYSSGQGTVYWGTSFYLYGTSSATAFDIYGDGHSYIFNYVFHGP